jgi:hypothetical protein
MFGLDCVVALALVTTPLDPADTALATALLTAQADIPETAPLPKITPALRSAMLKLAIDWEIMDPREARLTLVRRQEYRADLSQLRRRYHDLADAPRIQDSLRFPEREYINKLKEFNEAYRRHLELQRTVESSYAWQFQEALRETDQLYDVWDTLSDARCEYYYVAYRRQALKKLREMLGPDAYYRGQLPPPVPVWRFREIE